MISILDERGPLLRKESYIKVVGAHLSLTDDIYFKLLWWQYSTTYMPKSNR